VLSESFRTIIVVTGQKGRGEVKVTLVHVFASTSHVTPRCEHTLSLHECFIDFVFHLVAMNGKIEQRVSVKFCVKLGKSATKTLEMLREACGEHSLRWTAIFKWHSRFKAGRVSDEDDKRLGQPSESKTTEKC
jgi:hypothetical protein